MTSGVNTDIPTSRDYDGDGISDLAVYSGGYLSIYSLANGMILNNGGILGGPGWTTVPRVVTTTPFTET